MPQGLKLDYLLPLLQGLFQSTSFILKVTPNVYISRFKVQVHKLFVVGFFYSCMKLKSIFNVSFINCFLNVNGSHFNSMRFALHIHRNH